MRPTGNNTTGLILSSVYSRIINARNRSFDVKGGLHIGFPVISIGGIHAGGTGKTPMAILTGKKLRAAGKTSAFLSRGYKRKSKKPVLLEPGKTAGWQEIGDEPCMIRSELPESWLGIGADRYSNALNIAPALEAGKSCFILDDGFQHRQIHRDLDIVCLPPNPFNDLLIPAGYLREPVSSLSRADIICVIGSEEDSAAIEQNRCKVEQLFPDKLCISAIQFPGNWINVVTGEKQSILPLKNPALICGIARPERFIDMVEKSGIKTSVKIIRNDHHAFTRQDIRKAIKSGSDGIILTQKDACRLNPIKNLVHDTNLWYLNVEIKFSNKLFGDTFDAELIKLFKSK
jgi:tetraacyldisaccharide 4'-kinase